MAIAKTYLKRRLVLTRPKGVPLTIVQNDVTLTRLLSTDKTQYLNSPTTGQPLYGRAS